MIRLARQGAKKVPIYSIVAVSKSMRRDGRYLEKLGQYFPKADKLSEKLKVNRDAVQKWVDRGALMSETVGQLLKKTAR